MHSCDCFSTSRHISVANAGKTGYAYVGGASIDEFPTVRPKYSPHVRYIYIRLDLTIVRCSLSFYFIFFLCFACVCCRGRQYPAPKKLLLRAQSRREIDQLKKGSEPYIPPAVGGEGGMCNIVIRLRALINQFIRGGRRNRPGAQQRRLT